MKFLILMILALLMIAGCIFGLYWWDSSKNRGRTTGYWGEFNRTSNALASTPGVRITGGWHNHDATLEEFSFDVETNDQTATLFFGETHPIRTMSRAEASAALMKFIEIEIASTNESPFKQNKSSK